VDGRRGAHRLELERALVDLDLDGRKDVFVTNGLARDVTSQDYITFAANEEARAGRAGAQPASRRAGAGAGAGADYLALTRAMPSTPIPNYAFRNGGGAGSVPAFANEARAWGLDDPTFSSGAAYGDLDGDGAPDLVVNNVNGEASVYRNNARALRRAHHYLQVALAGAGANRFGVGARVTLRAGGETLMQEQAPTRGFQSSVDPVLTFGLGARAAVDTLTVEWPDGRTSVLAGVAADRRVTVRQAEAAPGGSPPPGRRSPRPTPGCSPRWPTAASSTWRTARTRTWTSTASASCRRWSRPRGRRSRRPT
jgi:hypothetical protein